MFQCFALEKREYKAQHCRNVLGLEKKLDSKLVLHSSVIIIVFSKKLNYLVTGFVLSNKRSALKEHHQTRYLQNTPLCSSVGCCLLLATVHTHCLVALTIDERKKIFFGFPPLCSNGYRALHWLPNRHLSRLFDCLAHVTKYESSR